VPELADLDHLRPLLRDDAAFQEFSGCGRTWTCPLCLATVEAEPDASAGVMLGAIRDHVAVCPEAGRGAAGVRPAGMRAVARLAADTAFRVAHDPAWQVRLGDGRWVCPGCLTAPCLPSAGLAEVQAHRATCAHPVHQPSEVVAAALRAAPAPARPADPGGSA
jgi:hypothetical protein